MRLVRLRRIALRMRARCMLRPLATRRGEACTAPPPTPPPSPRTPTPQAHSAIWPSADGISPVQHPPVPCRRPCPCRAVSRALTQDHGPAAASRRGRQAAREAGVCAHGSTCACQRAMPCRSVPRHALITCSHQQSRRVVAVQHGRWQGWGAHLFSVWLCQVKSVSMHCRGEPPIL